MKTDIRDKIKEVAVEHFNRDGYHGATIRNIAKDVGCSLPMIYYYYNNKKELFDEIIKKEYFELLKRQAALLKTENIIDFYTDFVHNLYYLSNYDKNVYRLGIKVYLSFDGDEELMKIMDEWEKTIVLRHYQLLKSNLNNKNDDNAVVQTLIHLLETLIVNIVVKNRFLSREDIYDEISIVLRDCK